MNAPQVIYIALSVFELTATLCLHACGKGQNFWIKLADKVLLTALLGWGGFFG